MTLHANVTADVVEFHTACGLPILTAPTIPDKNRAELRKSLITEEYNELIRAIDADDLVEIADAIADIVYATVGTALEYGLPFDAIWHEVQASKHEEG